MLRELTHLSHESLLGRLWRRLEAMDFINSGMLFAAVLLLCFVPFLIIVQALAGQDAATHLVRRFGLSSAAAGDVGRVFTSAANTSGAISGLSWVFFILGGIAAAASIQELYERSFEVSGCGMKGLPRQIAWLALLLAAGAVVAVLQPWLHDTGGPVILALFIFVGATVFWWVSMWLLLAGRRSWGELLPSAVATGVCWLGMDVAFRLSMSSSITTNFAKYGPIGVVFAIMSFLIAIGVVVILGAIGGVVWREWRESRSVQPTEVRDAQRRS